MIAGFAAAYMSTIATQLNWGASYIVNDFYRRFVVREGASATTSSPRKSTTVLLMVVSLVVTQYIDSIRGAWKLMMATGAGTGTRLLAALVLVADQRLVRSRRDDRRRGRVHRPATEVGLVERLEQRRPLAVRLPHAHHRGGDDPRLDRRHLPHPRRTARQAHGILPSSPPRRPRLAARPPCPRRRRPRPTESLGSQFVNWLLGCSLIYASLFGIGHLVFKNWLPGAGLLALALICGAVISRNLNFQKQCRGSTTAGAAYENATTKTRRARRRTKEEENGNSVDHAPVPCISQESDDLFALAPLRDMQTLPASNIATEHAAPFLISFISCVSWLKILFQPAD